MECGCAPGSWSQVAAKLINSGGLYDQGNLLKGIDNKTKAELPQEGISFHTQFPSLGIFINKKVGFRKN